MQAGAEKRTVQGIVMQDWYIQILRFWWNSPQEMRQSNLWVISEYLWEIGEILGDWKKPNLLFFYFFFFRRAEES